MNLPNPSASLAPQPASPMADEDDGINLLDMVDVLLDQKYLIAIITASVSNFLANDRWTFRRKRP